MSNLALVTRFDLPSEARSLPLDWQCSIAENGCAVITSPDGQAFEIEPGRQGFIDFIHRFAQAMEVTILQAAMYRHLRNKDVTQSFPQAGLFIGRVPDNQVLSGDDADAAVLSEMGR